MSSLNNYWPWGVLYLLLNGLAFFVMGRDKYLARRNRWRIPEKWLFTLAFCGGALGILLGMGAFRHKTKHKAFVWGIPILFIGNLGMICLVLKHL